MILGLLFLLAILGFFVWLVWSSPRKHRRFGDATGAGPYHGADTADGFMAATGGGNGGDGGGGGDNGA